MARIKKTAKAKSRKTAKKSTKDTKGAPTVNVGELVSNALLSRSQLMKQFLDPRRDIDDECGYPKPQDLTAEEYKYMYDRHAVATRVVQVLPKESWKVEPTVYETEEADKDTPFEEAWYELGQMLQGESWFKGDVGSPIWEYLRRVDELSGIGSFGLLLLGLDDEADLSEEVVPKEGMKLLFLRAFDESQIDIGTFETDIASPRYGQPTKYNISFNNPADQGQGGVGVPNTVQDVHWTRVIHVADNLGSSEIFGVPRMRPVFNNLMALSKLYGGSAEMYWRGAFPGLSIETHPQLAGDVEIDSSALKDDMENYMNGLQRYLALMGMSAKSLAPQVVDPTPQINVQLEVICIVLGIPKRIFVGSERGELASSQDDSTWNDRLQYRQNGYLTPRVIVPFCDRLILFKVLPEPESYSVVWPDLGALTQEEQATIAIKRTEAIAKYVLSGGDVLVSPIDFLTKVIGLTNEEAKSILETTAAEYVEPEEPEVVAARVAKIAKSAKE